MPPWLRALAQSPLEDVLALPKPGDTCDGECARPSVDEGVVSSDYLAFLIQQISGEVRGPMWTELLSSRYKALKPFEGQHVIHVFFHREPESVVMRFDAKQRKLIHVEVI